MIRVLIFAICGMTLSALSGVILGITLKEEIKKEVSDQMIKKNISSPVLSHLHTSDFIQLDSR